MTFRSSLSFETEEQEAARLAETIPALAKLPVNIKGSLQDRLIRLPWYRNYPQDFVMVVTPIEQRPSDRGERSMPIRIHDGWWNCAVVYSTHDSYSIGGHRLYISEAELVRGVQVDIEHSINVAGAETDSALFEYLVEQWGLLVHQLGTFPSKPARDSYIAALETCARQLQTTIEKLNGVQQKDPLAIQWEETASGLGRCSICTGVIEDRALHQKWHRERGY